jgi:dipeptidyl-peptidase-4
MRRLALLCAALAPMTVAAAERLTIERIFAEPDLAGPSLRLPKLSPDGTRVTYLRAKADDIARYDLWEYDVESGEQRLLVDSNALVTGPETLSDEEKARRERQRTSSLSGIVEYQFSRDGSKLLFPLGGDLHLYDLAAPPGKAARRLTNDAAAETDPKFSPRGRYVSFVRDQNLYAIELASGREIALTRDGGGLVRNGMAEFIAQEEMGRDTGYWWSPDEKRIAFTRTDDSGVLEVERFEILAEGAQAYRQRYPAAGTANTKIALGVVALDGGNVRWIDLGPDEDIYLARVDWFPDNEHLLVQRQTRDQKRLDLLRADAATGATTLLFSETSDTWVELHDDLAFLRKQDAFVWGSSRSGFHHLYLYANDGRLIRPLTAGRWSVTPAGASGRGLLGVDESRGVVYFVATEKHPTERHLYRTSLDTKDPERVTRITREDGWHDIALAAEAGIYVDQHSSFTQPPQVSVHRVDGRRLGYVLENRLDASHPYAPYAETSAPPELGTLEAADGQTLYYRLDRPARLQPGRRYPVVIDVYGGPHGQRVRNAWLGHPRTMDGLWRNYLNQEGYIVFSLDNRGTGNRGTAFDAPIYRRLGQVEVEDQIRGVEYLRTLPYVDPERIGVFGWSYGGYMALLCVLRAPDAFAAAVSGAPVTDWRLYDTHYTERYLGDPRTDPAAYDAASVFAWVDDLRRPLLLMHGMADDNVLFTNSTKLMGVLQAKNEPFELMTYPGAKHGLLRHRDTGVHAYSTIARFLDAHLKRAK